MKKFKPFFSFALFIFLLELLGVLIITAPGIWTPGTGSFRSLSTVLLGAGFLGVAYLLIRKGRLKPLTLRILKICNLACLSMLLAFSAFCILAFAHPYQGGFSTTATLFDRKNVMVVVPHQDDDINLAGGLIEQYTAGGSEVTVVFTTNGDRYGKSELRAAEAVRVLTALGVEKEDIYYMGFGDQWEPLAETGHIYNSPDPDSVWTSLYGAAATYGTENIGCYLELPYTRNNYVYSIQSILAEKKPDTIFAVDFDSHIDHKATDLFFEEALCNVLTLYPDYHPAVYKGFCYGTAWNAVDDFFCNANLQSSKHPDSQTWSDSAYGYAWEQRSRFPVSQSNLNWISFNNSVFAALDRYTSQDAVWQATRILNGDKVFWQRRTDSLLYGAEVFVGGQKTDTLNDFKLKDFDDLADSGCVNSGFVPLQDQKVTVQAGDVIAVNRIHLYDNPDTAANILSGFITFSDGSRVDFSGLNQDGSATVLTFPEKQVNWMEITVTGADSGTAGLSEIEAFFDAAPAQASETCLMAVDAGGNFVYDYLLRGSNSVSLIICSFPDKKLLNTDDISLSFEAGGKRTSYCWEADQLVVTCEKGAHCRITISDGLSSTTFTVSNPTDAGYAYLRVLRFTDRHILNVRSLVFYLTGLLESILMDV